MKGNDVSVGPRASRAHFNTSGTRASHKGWHSRGYLPHFDSPETVQFVTFRTVDSLPREIYRSLAAEAQNPGVLRKIAESYLDEGRGQCWLGRPEIAETVEHALLHFDGERYRLHAWVIMPNHVHAIVEPIGGDRLGDIVGSWKSFTAKQANAQLARTGPFWAPEYFDRFIRDDAHLGTAVSYVEDNPVNAGLVASAQDWAWSSARAGRAGKAGGTPALRLQEKF